MIALDAIRKAADIPDDVMYHTIRSISDEKVAAEPGWQWGSMWVMVDEIQSRFPSVPKNIVRAKLGQLLRRKDAILTGCICGCRGDFEFIGGDY